MARKKRGGNVGSAAYASGKRFEVALCDSIKYIETMYGAPTFVTRLLDSSSYGSRRKHNHESHCDVIAIWHGVTLYIEAKTSVGATSYEMRYIGRGQIDGMVKSELAGAPSYFIFGKKNKAYEVERAFAVKASVVATWDGRASVPWAEIATSGFELERYPSVRKNHKERWNLEVLWL